MSFNDRSPIQRGPDTRPRYFFTGTHTSALLKESIALVAAVTSLPAALVLQDERGRWYRDGSGLLDEQLGDIEAVLSLDPAQAALARLPHAPGLQILETRTLQMGSPQRTGTLCLLSPAPLLLSLAQQQSMEALVAHIQSILNMDGQETGSPQVSQVGTALPLMPGLLHELGSFMFGISANLDAFEARFASLEEVHKYGVHIRKSLDQMQSFIADLREYVKPLEGSTSMVDLAPLLRETMEDLSASATGKSVDLHLQIEGSLPPFKANRESLKQALHDLIEIVLLQEEPGGRVDLTTATEHQEDLATVCGHLDFPGKKMKGFDPTRLFEPFGFRAPGVGRFTLPGVRRVIEAQGGILTAGAGPGGRMRIRFTFPS